MVRTAAVTGATGFLGSHLTHRLVDDGWAVTGLARHSSDRSACPPELRWVVGDITDQDALEDLLEGADVVFHLAGVGLWQADPATVRAVNVEGTRAVLEAARTVGVDRVVFTSTAGTRRRSGQSAATEDDVATPVGAYQTSKAAAELLVSTYAREHDAVTVHPTAVVGPGDGSITAQLVAMAKNPAYVAHPPGGLSVVGVQDVVDGILAAASHGESGEHYILGGENLSYRQAVERIGAVVDGSPARLEVPPMVIHAAGPVAAAVGATTGRRVFPFDAAMAALATQYHFYSSRTANEQLGYTYDPVEAIVPSVLEGAETPETDS